MAGIAWDEMPRTLFGELEIVEEKIWSELTGVFYFMRSEVVGEAGKVKVRERRFMCADAVFAWPWIVRNCNVESLSDSSVDHDDED